MIGFAYLLPKRKVQNRGKIEMVISNDMKLQILEYGKCGPILTKSFKIDHFYKKVLVVPLLGVQTVFVSLSLSEV